MKNYVKPEIAFESFEMSATFAASCINKDVDSTQGNCAYSVGGNAYFTDSVSACTTKWIDGEENSLKVCYTIPTSDSNLFNS